jgi:hypothetical protein
MAEQFLMPTALGRSKIRNFRTQDTYFKDEVAIVAYLRILFEDATNTLGCWEQTVSDKRSGSRNSAT